MPRTRRAAASAPVIPTNSLVASAVRYPGRMDRIFLGQKDWQKEAWRHYDICPELRYASGWVGSALSRITLYPAEVQADGTKVRTDDPQIAGALHALFSGADGQAQMLASLGLHLTIAGEGYLVGRNVNDTDVWEIIGIRELSVAGNSWTINYGDGNPPTVLGPDDVVIRIWRPHPAKRIEADSAVRALLPVLREIEYLTRHIFAQTTSRLVGSGILPLPQSLSFPAAQTPEGQAASDNQAENFMALLGETMSAALKDQGSAASLVPIVITVPDEAMQYLKEPLHFWSPFDEAAVTTRNAAVRRFAVGMDLPPEVILGMTSSARGDGGVGNGASHWMGWQIEESAIKLHVEPVVELICNAIAISYLRPISGNNAAAIGFDSGALKLQPDRSKESFELWDRGELDDETLLVENGFSKDNMPSDDERKKWLLRKIATGSATPDQVGAALKQLGVDLGPLPQSQDAGTRQAPLPPTLDEHPTRSAPDTRAALYAASEVLVFRALERAGNRLRSASAKPPGVPAAETYLYLRANGSTSKMLEDAWTCVPAVMAGLGDADKVTEALDAYCHALLEEQAPHSRERMQLFLDRAI